jgi:Cellulase (glycosyl hydrolase family 5)
MTRTTGTATGPVAPQRPPGRRPMLLLIAVVVVIVVAAVTWFVVGRSPGETQDPRPAPADPGGSAAWEPLASSELEAADDALHRRSLAELKVFTDWLAANDAEGYIGEVGIPGGQDLERWMVLGQRWFTAAEEAGLWVDVWSVGEWWRQGYTYSPFVTEPEDGPLSITTEQGELLMWAAENTDLPRGVNLSGGEFGAPGGSDEGDEEFSNENPGTYDEDYHYDSQESLDYLASRGIDTVRLPFRWERIQPQIGGPLDADELDRLQAMVGRANSAGLQVILDVQNFGSYHLAQGDTVVRAAIGSEQLPVSAFADLWSRLSEAFDGAPGVLAYDLMNEPVYLGADADLVSMEADEDLSGAKAWEGASQAAVDAIRARGDDTLIMVPSYGYSHPGEWAEWHPEAWINDPADNFRYEAHHYWSAEQGESYDDDLAEAVDDGF